LMRQAGRYLPEYRALRAQAGDFMTLCQTPELACEVTLQPLARFPLDAAILFSDILTLPDAMGLGLHFVAGEGPRFARPLKTAADIERLSLPEPESSLNYVMTAIRLIKQELKNRLPLIGFAGSPWTLAAYMLEGGSSDNFAQAKKLLYADSRLMHLLLDKLAQALVAYLRAQITAGVDAVMIFDTWGGLLTPKAYEAFSLHYLKEIVQQLKAEPQARPIPCILFTKNSGQWLEKIAATGCEAVGLDWMTDLNLARQRIGHQVALQGNLDLGLLYTSPERIRAAVAESLAEFGPHPGHIFNLGHGVPQNVPVENVAALVQAVHELSLAYHA